MGCMSGQGMEGTGEEGIGSVVVNANYELRESEDCSVSNSGDLELGKSLKDN